MTEDSRYTVHEGRWTLEDRFESPWHYLPVEVRPGTAGLRVELAYEQAGETVLDLGCLGPAGFRGWSGGARSWFAITAEEATPGYLPGELEAGLWQVMIGLYRVPPDGVPYRVTVRASGHGAGLVPPAPAAPPAPRERAAPRDLPAGPGRRWLAGDLHAHTVHSDGALTDVGWIDFRREPDHWLDATQARGGLLSVNHPFAGPLSWTHPMRRRPPLAEVWHWSWLDKRWTLPFAWWLAWDPGAIPVGGSDWHRPGSEAPPGCPTTWVECAGREPGDVLDGLRAGRVAISAERDGPVLLRHDGELVAVQADGTVLAGPGGPYARVRGDRV